MPIVAAVAVGGALGALARYGLDRFIEHHLFTVFPWSTLAINVTGCLLAGLAIGGIVERHEAPAWLRVGAVVGFLGAYTTFSTFAQETLDLLEADHAALGLLNTAASVATGVAAVYVGLALGRSV
jgi:CrcB protein